MKKIGFIVLVLICIVVSYSCTNKGSDTEKINNDTELDIEVDTYVVTNEDELVEGLNDSYSITIKNDIVSKNDFIMEGDFLITNTTEKHDVKEVKRRLNLTYDNTNHTITSPKFIIKSNHTILKDGIYKGDMYIEASDVVLNSFKVEGNVYFKNEKVRKSFVLENGSSITGELKVQ